MKIHKTVNPVAYENTYYLEGDQHLIVVDPGSHWEAIRKTIEKINKPVCAILLTHTVHDTKAKDKLTIAVTRIVIDKANKLNLFTFKFIGIIIDSFHDLQVIFIIYNYT